MERDIPKAKKQFIKAFFLLCLCGGLLYYKGKLTDSQIDRICHEHMEVTTEFMKLRQYYPIEKNEFLKGLYERRWYSSEEKERVEFYLDKVYEYPVANTKEDKDHTIEQFTNYVYETCKSKKTHVAN